MKKFFIKLSRKISTSLLFLLSVVISIFSIFVLIFLIINIFNHPLICIPSIIIGSFLYSILKEYIKDKIDDLICYFDILEINIQQKINNNTMKEYKKIKVLKEETEEEQTIEFLNDI